MNNKLIFTLLFPLLSPVALAASFTVQDQNNDSNISKDEWYGAIGNAEVFKDWDSNGHGFINETEYDSYDYDYSFDDWDANDEDLLDDNEFYDGWFNTFDDNDNDIGEANERNDAGDAGLFDV